MFVAATESFSQRNINCSIAESLERAQPVFAAAQVERHPRARLHFVRAGLPVRRRRRSRRGARHRRTRCARSARTKCRSATRSAPAPPAGRSALIDIVAERVPVAMLAGHFHDTYGQALTNVYASLEIGVATFDCSVAGLGGCPYAKGATGNVASEDVVYLLEGLGIDTGVDMTRLRRAGRFISDCARRASRCRASRACARRQGAAARARVEPSERDVPAQPHGDVPSPCISVCTARRPHGRRVHRLLPHAATKSPRGST